jgi:hypothetical protein
MPFVKERFEFRVSDTESIVIEGTRSLPSRFLSSTRVTSTVVTEGKPHNPEYKAAVDGVTSFLLALYTAGMMYSMKKGDIQDAINVTFAAIADNLGDD